MAVRGTSIGVERLVADLTTDAFGDELASWLTALPRFRAFVESHRDKIRKKLRLAVGADAVLDVRAELLVARLLLADRHIELQFEPGGAIRGGPDFAVAYRRAHAFSLEVTRPRRTDAGRPILAKLRQLPTGGANVLLLAVPAASDSWDVGAEVRAIRARADAKEEEFFTRRGFVGTRDFYDRFLRLGAVITWLEPTARGGGRADAWMNGSARIPVQERPLRECLAALRSPAAPPGG